MDMVQNIVKKAYCVDLNANVIFNLALGKYLNTKDLTLNPAKDLILFTLKNVKYIDNLTGKWAVECIKTGKVKPHPSHNNKILDPTLLHLEDAAVMPELPFPKEMLVWNDYEKDAVIDTVHAILPNRPNGLKVITSNASYKNAKKLVIKSNFTFEEVVDIIFKYHTKASNKISSKEDMTLFLKHHSAFKDINTKPSIFDKRFSVIIVKWHGRKTPLIKMLTETLNITIKRAIMLLDRMPIALASNITWQRAAIIKTSFESIGANIEIIE